MIEQNGRVVCRLFGYEGCRSGAPTAALKALSHPKTLEHQQQECPPFENRERWGSHGVVEGSRRCCETWNCEAEATCRSAQMETAPEARSHRKTVVRHSVQPQYWPAGVRGQVTLRGAAPLRVRAWLLLELGSQVCRDLPRILPGRPSASSWIRSSGSSCCDANL